jgi:hypothetical protein
MTTRKRPVDGGGATGSGRPVDRVETGGSGQEAPAVDADGPQSAAPWGSAGGIDREPPWGVSEDSPMDEGSEPTAAPEGRRGERRAGPPSGAGHLGLGPVEPTRVTEAGPGGAPDAAPGHRPFPDEVYRDDLPDNPLERQTGMRPEGVSRRES